MHKFMSNTIRRGNFCLYLKEGDFHLQKVYFKTKFEYIF